MFLMFYRRLSVIVSVILLCLALSLVVEWPAEAWPFAALGSPLAARLFQAWLAAVLLTGMACSGTVSILRLHPLAQKGQLPHTFVFWILPALATLLAAVLLPRASSPIHALGGLAVTGIALPLIIAGEYHTIDPNAKGHQIARFGLNFAAYAIALVLFAAIRQSRAHEFLLGLATLGGSGLLALDLLYAARQNLKQTGLHALIVGLVMGEIIWGLSYVRMSNLTATILLLLIFYLVTGLARQGLLGSLGRRVLIEFAAVALIGLALLLRYGP